MRIYTGRGDEGQTDLMGADRVSKAHPRIEAYGTVDEVNALVGATRPTGHDDVDDRLAVVQNHLHIVQARLSCPGGDNVPELTEADVEAVEAWIDEWNEELDPLNSFVLPGGCEAGARLHRARAVCRRAERRVVALTGQDDEEVAGEVVTYLNRLSDAFFVAARLVNSRAEVKEETPDY